MGISPSSPQHDSRPPRRDGDDRRTVELVLRQHPRILDAAVVAVPGESVGSPCRDVGTIRPVPGSRVRPDEPIAWCLRTLSTAFTPRAWAIVDDDLPFSEFGTVDRAALVEQFRSGHLRSLTTERRSERSPA
jgi:acyl-CoA synthetase (AMP-forming)/AMP-acid ligase II